MGGQSDLRDTLSYGDRGSSEEWACPHSIGGLAAPSQASGNYHLPRPSITVAITLDVCEGDTFRIPLTKWPCDTTGFQDEVRDDRQLLTFFTRQCYFSE